VRLDPSTGSVSLESDQTSNFQHSLRVDQNDDPVWFDGSVYRWGTGENTISEVFDPNAETAELRPYSGDFYLGLYNQGGIRKHDLDGSELWQDGDATTKAIDTTSSAVYAGVWDSLIKYDHSGSVQWRWTEPSEVIEVEAGPSGYVYPAETNGAVSQVDKSDGTASHLVETASSDADFDVDTDPDGYVYVTDQTSITVMDPADGSLVLSKDVGGTVGDIEARSDGIYVEAGDKLYKFDKSGF
jgi:hypothetical protein